MNGVMMPYKWTYGWISGQEEYALTEIQAERPGGRSEVRQARPTNPLRSSSSASGR